MTQYLRVSLDEMRKHIDHQEKVTMSVGSANMMGETPKTQFSLWCSVCNDTVAERTIKKEGF